MHRRLTRFLNDQSGLSLVEMLVVMAIIILLSVVGLRSYDRFIQQGRDRERMSQLHRFQVALEQFKTQHGVYPCGDGSQYASAGIGTTDASQENGFLGGIRGKCNSGGGPTGPTCWSQSQCPSGQTCDSSWHNLADGNVSNGECIGEPKLGLFAYGYLAEYFPQDPLNAPLSGERAYYYDYMVSYDRQSYILSAVTESDTAAALNDGGFCNVLYEVGPGVGKLCARADEWADMADECGPAYANGAVCEDF